MKGLVLRRGAAFLICFLGVAAGAQERAAAGGARIAPTAVGASSVAMTRHDVRLGRVDPDHDDHYLYGLPYAAGQSTRASPERRRRRVGLRSDRLADRFG